MVEQRTEIVSTRRRKWQSCLVVGLVIFATQAAFAHPLPELPVRAFFEEDGSARFEVEVDPRCFSEDPEKELYMLNWYLERCDETEKNEMLEQAKTFLPTRIKVIFGPGEWNPEPEYSCRFTRLGGKPLKKLDDPVVIRVSWKLQLPPAIRTYEIKAHKVGILSVLFLNHVNDRAVPRIQTLFPGEKSYRLTIR